MKQSIDMISQQRLFSQNPSHQSQNIPRQNIQTTNNFEQRQNKFTQLPCTPSSQVQNQSSHVEQNRSEGINKRPEMKVLIRNDSQDSTELYSQDQTSPLQKILKQQQAQRIRQQLNQDFNNKSLQEAQQNQNQDLSIKQQSTATKQDDNQTPIHESLKYYLEQAQLEVQQSEVNQQQSLNRKCTQSSSQIKKNYKDQKSQMQQQNNMPDQYTNSQFIPKNTQIHDLSRNSNNSQSSKELKFSEALIDIQYSKISKIHQEDNIDNKNIASINNSQNIKDIIELENNGLLKIQILIESIIEIFLTQDFLNKEIVISIKKLFKNQVIGQGPSTNENCHNQVKQIQNIQENQNNQAQNNNEKNTFTPHSKQGQTRIRIQPKSKKSRSQTNVLANDEDLVQGIKSFHQDAKNMPTITVNSLETAHSSPKIFNCFNNTTLQNFEELDVQRMKGNLDSDSSLSSIDVKQSNDNSTKFIQSVNLSNAHVENPQQKKAYEQNLRLSQGRDLNNQIPLKLQTQLQKQQKQCEQQEKTEDLNFNQMAQLQHQNKRKSDDHEMQTNLRNQEVINLESEIPRFDSDNLKIPRKYKNKAPINTSIIQNCQTRNEISIQKQNHKIKTIVDNLSNSNIQNNQESSAIQNIIVNRPSTQLAIKPNSNNNNLRHHQRKYSEEASSLFKDPIKSRNMPQSISEISEKYNIQRNILKSIGGSDNLLLIKNHKQTKQIITNSTNNNTSLFNKNIASGEVDNIVNSNNLSTQSRSFISQGSSQIINKFNGNKLKIDHKLMSKPEINQGVVSTQNSKEQSQRLFNFEDEFYFTTKYQGHKIKTSQGQNIYQIQQLKGTLQNTQLPPLQKNIN